MWSTRGKETGSKVMPYGETEPHESGVPSNVLRPLRSTTSG